MDDKGQFVGIRYVLDHCLILIKANHTNWGPKPFKVFNCWFEHQDFVPFVEEVWKSSIFQGKYAFVLKEKLKILKGRL